MNALRKFARYIYVGGLMISVFVVSFLFGGKVNHNAASSGVSILESETPFAYADAPITTTTSQPPATTPPLTFSGSGSGCGGCCSSCSSN